MSKLVYGVEVWQYYKGCSEDVSHWVDRVFTTEDAARKYAEKQGKTFYDPESADWWDQDWEIVYLVLQDGEEQ
jgi:hypothetical protein